MRPSKTSRRKTAPISLTLYKDLSCKGLFHELFCFGFIFVLDIFQVKEGLFLFADAARMGVCDEAIVSGTFALGPLINIDGFFIKSLLIEGLIGVECGRICVLSNGQRLLTGSRLGLGRLYRRIGKGLVIGGKIEDAPTVSEHQTLNLNQLCNQSNSKINSGSNKNRSDYFQVYIKEYQFRECFYSNFGLGGFFRYKRNIFYLQISINLVDYVLTYGGFSACGVGYIFRYELSFALRRKVIKRYII